MVKLITIIVGNTTFTARRNILEKSALIRTILETKGKIVIERNPKIFEHVLKLLKNPHYVFPEKYLEELIFYGIEYQTTDEYLKKKEKERIIAEARSAEEQRVVEEKIIEEYRAKRLREETMAKDMCKEIFAKEKYSVVSCNFTSPRMTFYDFNGNVIKDLDLEEFSVKKYGIKAKDNSIDAMALSPNQEMLVSGGKDVVIWNIKSGHILHRIKNQFVKSVAFSHDNKWVASGCGSDLGTNKGLIKIWDVKTGLIVHTLKDHTERIGCIAFSHDNKMLVSGGFDGMIKVWDLERGKLKITINGHDWDVKSVIFSPDDKMIMSGSVAIKVWYGDNYQQSFNLKEFYKANSMAFSHDGTEFAIGGESGIDVYDSQSFQLLYELNCGDRVFSIKYSPDDNLMVAGCFKGINIWNITPSAVTCGSGRGAPGRYLVQSIKTKTSVESVAIYS